MAWTQSDIDALKANIAKGARRMKLSSGEEIEFQTRAEMRRTLAEMEADVSGSDANTINVSNPKMSRGL